LAHVVATARALQPDAIHVVHGHGAEAVRAAIPGADIRWSLQSEQKGTGHAVAQAMPGVPDGHDVLVLYGDVPLIRAETLAHLTGRVKPASIAILSAKPADPAGYGRIVRDAAGRVVRIVEERDANTRERKIREINSGILCAPTDKLRDWLSRLTNRNAQKEYYLTDIVPLAIESNTTVTSANAA